MKKVQQLLECAYKETDHDSKCCQAITELWLAKKFCDVNIIVPDITGSPVIAIPVHRLVLVANIPYFAAMFENDMRETKQTDITLQGCSPAAVKLLLEFAYTRRSTCYSGDSPGSANHRRYPWADTNSVLLC